MFSSRLPRQWKRTRRVATVVARRSMASFKESLRARFAGVNEFHAKHPLLSNCLTAGTLFLSGDLLCQHIEKWRMPEDKRHEWKYDSSRSMRMTTFGFLGLGPFGHT